MPPPANSGGDVQVRPVLPQRLEVILEEVAEVTAAAAVVAVLEV
jgi:hypothetical protein